MFSPDYFRKTACTLLLNSLFLVCPHLPVSHVTNIATLSSILNTVSQAPQGISAVRLAYADRHIETPSKAAIPSEFAALQKRPLDQVFCSRPREIADPIPVTLLEPIFAQFVDDCQNYEPTDDDHAFVAKLSHQMCNFYSTEPERLHDFRQIFQSYGITLHNATVGHMLVGTHVRVILEGKNEIGSGGAEPFAEAMLYYRKFLRFVEDRENMFKEHKALLPCFHIICFG